MAKYRNVISTVVINKYNINFLFYIEYNESIGSISCKDRLTLTN
jgi:hypothetical protein